MPAETVETYSFKPSPRGFFSASGKGRKHSKSSYQKLSPIFFDRPFKAQQGKGRRQGGKGK